MSAADGTNIVQVFQEAIQFALDFKTNPPDSYETEFMALLKEENWIFGSEKEKQNESDVTEQTQS